MQIAMSQTRQQYPLSTRKILKKTIASTILFMILGAFLVVPVVIILSTSVTRDMVVIPLVILILLILSVPLILIIYLYQRWYFAVYFYDLTQDFIVIRKGPITPREITIPYERVQDVYVDQDLFDRILGIYDVHLSSATISSGMEAHIDGLEKPHADGLRTLLLQTVSQRINRYAAQSQPPPVPVNPNLSQGGQ